VAVSVTTTTIVCVTNTESVSEAVFESYYL
jgi:hypothetical protein